MHHLLAVRGAPGDTVAVSGLVRDYAATFPDNRLSVKGCGADEFFAADPRVVPAGPKIVEVKITFTSTIDTSKTDTTKRYLYAAHEDFERQTGIHVPRGPARPDLILSESELATSGDLEPYAVLAAGFKSDMPIKAWPSGYFEEVIKITAARGWRWKQVGALDNPGSRIKHYQPTVPGAEDLVGKTSFRDLMVLIARARAVLCLTSLPMLLAAAFNVPCVVVGGGREDPWLFTDLGVRYLDTIGRYDCCRSAGCRRAFARPVHTESPYPPNTLCELPVGDFGRCMTDISPAEVAAALTVLVPAFTS